MGLLEIRSLRTGYHRAPVVWDLDLAVETGEIVALLGANGAGKTTSLLAACGYLPILGGSVHFDGKPVRFGHGHRLARRGLALVPEHRTLIASLTVADNLRLVHPRPRDPYELFPELVPLQNRKAGLLSGGEQQMLAIARAFASSPKLLVVDELSLGLAPLVVARLMEAVREMARSDGTSVLIVEQHVQRVLEVADRGAVMVHGRKVIDAPAAELRADRKLVEASYLGDAVLATRDIND
jgi:branched-chain amino acid transport system ATP-binding protein